MSALGRILLAAILLLYGFAVVLALVALKKEAQAARKTLCFARRIVFVAAVLSVLVLLLFVSAFLANDFSIAAVAGNSSAELPFIYKISAVYADSAGLFLLWFVIIFVLFAFWQHRNSESKIEQGRERFLEDDKQYVISDVAFNATAMTVGAGLCLGFSALLIFIEKPFASGSVIVSSGKGLDPALQNFLMILYAPLLFIGYSAFMIPFVIILAGVFSVRAQDYCIYRQLRRWL